jgi:hypothetical protein
MPEALGPQPGNRPLWQRVAVWIRFRSAAFTAWPIFALLRPNFSSTTGGQQVLIANSHLHQQRQHYETGCLELATGHSFER